MLNKHRKCAWGHSGSSAKRPLHVHLQKKKFAAKNRLQAPVYAVLTKIYYGTP
jgi:hypothetical protein